MGKASARKRLRRSNAPSSFGSKGAFGTSIWSQAALVLVALLRNWGRVDTSWRFERGGWWLLFGGWSLISALVFITSPQSVLAWGSYAAFAVSGFIRGQAVRLTEERTRIVKDQEEEEEEEEEERG